MEKEFIGIADLAESFEKAMIADVIVGQTRTPEQKMANEATFYLAKSRVGKDGFFYDATFNTALTQIHVRELDEKEARSFTKNGKPSGRGNGLSKSQRKALEISLDDLDEGVKNGTKD